MRAPLIGLVGLRGDDEAESVARALRQLGTRVAWLDFRGHPVRKQGFLTTSTAQANARYDSVELDALDACYIRQSGYNWPYPRAAESAGSWTKAHSGYQPYLEQELQCLSFKECLLRLLSRRIPVVNPQPLQELHRLKVYQLWLLERAGISVARTLTSNDPDQLRAFAATLPGAVRKPLAGVLKTGPWQAGDEQSAELQRRPALLQELYPGRTVRCYVVDDQLIASAEILHGDAVDSSIEQCGIKPAQLPDPIIDMVRRAARTLGLLFSGVDVQHDQERDRYAILECNISPMFANFSRMIGIDVPAALATLLVRLARQHAGAGQ